MIDVAGKNVLIFGVASEDSIAWAIAKRFHQAGAKISLGYQHQFKSRIQKLAKSGEVSLAYREVCDVNKTEEIDHFFANVPAPIDVLVHSIAYTDPETFRKPASKITREQFSTALGTSSYSLIPLVDAALPKMAPEATVLAMSYLGSQRVVANYKLMGIAKAALEATVRELAVEVGPRGVRVNAISAGPLKTLAASQIKDFDQMCAVYDEVAPLRRTISQDDVADLALFLGSDLARNITGQTIFVDAGFSIVETATYRGGDATG